MESKRVVITGGPGTGKTSVIQQLTDEGFTCVPEIIRSMTEAAKLQDNANEVATNPLAFVDDPMAFNLKLLEGRTKQFLNAIQHDQDLVFFDRGIPDVLAYMDYFNQKYSDDFVRACDMHRYDLAIILPPWKEIYASDSSRLENFQEATEIHNHLLGTYNRFQYNPIFIPKGSVAERVSLILDLIKQ
ncbi:MAG: ATP-binding protein [Flavobacteriaceae bacterium]|nr:ATP-binding protein [Flavobacteriaceae bacterium]MDH3796752.1 ATP-binding protein [Flavobacteriaceae bacterium]